MTKTCSECNTEKPLDEFHKHKNHRDGKQSHCKACMRKKRNAYLSVNRGKLYKENKIYREANKEKIARQQQTYYKANKERINARNRNYYKKHKKNLIEASRVYSKQKRSSDPVYKLTLNLRTRLRDALQGKNKSATTKKLLGCTFEHAHAHLESKFTIGMNWDNYGLHGWHVDHIIPCASFDLTDPDQQRQCFHYTNLQPLWAKDNLRKSDKLPHEL